MPAVPHLLLWYHDILLHYVLLNFNSVGWAGYYTIASAILTVSASCRKNKSLTPIETTEEVRGRLSAIFSHTPWQPDTNEHLLYWDKCYYIIWYNYFAKEIDNTHSREIWRFWRLESSRSRPLHRRPIACACGLPGSGKTSFNSQNSISCWRKLVRPWNILAITFTNKAEMKYRMEQLSRLKPITFG